MTDISSARQALEEQIRQQLGFCNVLKRCEQFCADLAADGMSISTDVGAGGIHLVLAPPAPNALANLATTETPAVSAPGDEAEPEVAQPSEALAEPVAEGEGSTMPARQGAPWTAEEVAQIAEMHRRGISIRTIASETGRSEATISNRLSVIRKASEATPPPAKPSALATVKAAIEEVRADARTPLQIYIANRPVKGGWTLARDIDLLQHDANGWGFQEIAADLKVKPAELRDRLDTLTDSRRFARSEVLAELQRLAGASAAA